jgi:hypothetical protein
MIYRFKVWFEEDEDICRVIDVSPISSFEVFFNAIIDAIGFNKKLDSSFYISDDNWRKGKEISLKDSTKLLMSQAKLNTHINDPHQKFILITDFNEEWTLLVELQSIQNDVKGINYPLVFKSTGKAPKQNEGVGRFKIVDENMTSRMNYADENSITKLPEKEIKLPSVDVTFKFTNEHFKVVERAAGVLQLPEVVVTGDGKNIYFQAEDSKVKNGDHFSLTLGETDRVFKAIFKIDNLKIIPGEYEVSLSSKGLAHFSGKDIEYWIAIEQSSTF